MTTRFLTGDCRAVLKTLPAESVHCVVTSPPYWGLRDYGTAKWDGGDPSCNHSSMRRNHVDEKQATQAGSSRDKVGRDCRHCGAVRVDGQIGLEPDFNNYIATMVAIFREARRVLRLDGTLWLNLGDSYATGGYSKPHTGLAAAAEASDGKARKRSGPRAQLDIVVRGRPPDGIKPKDLCGIPWRVAFALQADGWWLRQDIIWAKPNPMPESVTDRCTKAHEYMFLLSKSERYYYDADAIKEEGSGRVCGNKNYKYDGLIGHETKHGFLKQSAVPHVDRNKRSVWEIATAPFSEAHFATMPPALIEPCIKAGCPIGGTILDPFAGAGTTGLVADRLQRSAILIEINPAYVEMARRRIFSDAPLFAEAAE